MNTVQFIRKSSASINPTNLDNYLYNISVKHFMSRVTH